MTAIARRFATLVSGLTCIACALPASPPPQLAPSAGPDLAALDRSVKPGDDFWAYANGAWLRATEIPADRSDAGIGQDRHRAISADRRRRDARPFG